MDTLRQDIRYSLRQLRMHPGFTAAVVLTLALGIGANTAMFSVLNAVLFRRAPAAQPDRLVWVTATHGPSRRPRGLSFPDYFDVRARSRQLGGVLAYTHAWLSLGGGVPERIRGDIITANYFPVLGVAPTLGRAFNADEEKPGGPRVAMLSDGFWRRRFGADPTILGHPVVINGLPFTVVGIAPRGFEGIEINDDAPLAVWLPMGALAEAEATPDARGLFTDRLSSGWIRTAARLAPGATLASANAELGSIGPTLRPAPTTPEDAYSLSASPLLGGVDPSNRSEALPVLSLLMVVPLLVLVVACANAANILLSRSLARRKELSIRRALGASRTRIVRQLLTESVLLSIGGAGIGVLLSVLLTSMIAGIGAIPPGVVAAFTPDGSVLLATTVVAFAAGVLFGLAPAFTATSPELTPALKNETVTFGVGRERHRLRDLLVVAQVSVALMLIVIAGLFMKSLSKAMTADPGFIARQGLYLSFDLDRQRYDSTRQEVFRRDVLRTVMAVPGVRSAALATTVPFGGHFEGTSIATPGSSDPDGVSTFVSSVTPEFFSTLEVPLVAGRAFTEADNAAAAPVIVINERVANQLWPGESPIGKQVRLGGRELRQVVGVTRTGKYSNLVESPTGQVYVPLAQRASGSLFLVVRTQADPGSVVPAVRQAAQSLDSDLPLYDLMTFEASILGGADMQRAGSAALSVFGLLALVLTLVGVYGVTAQGVTLRTREIGIRISLGARATDVLRLFVGEGVKRSLVGIVVGSVVSLALSKVLARYLFGLTATDAMSFAVGAAVVLFGVMLASGLPARRATQVDPLVALRAE